MPRTAAAMVEPEAEVIIDRAAEQRLHADGAANHYYFDIEAFVTVEAFDLSDPKRHLGDRGRADRESNLFELRRNRRSDGDRTEVAANKTDLL